MLSADSAYAGRGFGVSAFVSQRRWVRVSKHHACHCDFFVVALVGIGDHLVRGNVLSSVLPTHDKSRL